MAQLFGVDISEFQGTVDWDQLNAVSNFVVIRASFGTARKDNQFDRNQAEARRVHQQAGPLGVSFYYYAYPALLDPIMSADYFLDNLGPLQEGEGLALDLEGNIGSDPVGWSHRFLLHCHDRSGVKPLIYLNQSIMNNHDWSPVINDGFGLWLAAYDGNMEAAPPTSPWPIVAMRQWSNADHIAGISNAVDGDVFYGDFDQFFAYGYKSISTPAPAPTPTPVPAPPTPEPAPPVGTPPTTSPGPAPSPSPVVVPPPSVVPTPGPFIAVFSSTLGRLLLSALAFVLTPLIMVWNNTPAHDVTLATGIVGGVGLLLLIRDLVNHQIPNLPVDSGDDRLDP